MTDVRAPNRSDGNRRADQKPVFFKIMNRMVNPVLGLVLRSPAHRLVSGWVAEMQYTGRRSGRSRRVVVMYAAHEDGRLVIAAGSPEDKAWWRNFLDGTTPVTIRVGGQVRVGHAAVVADPDRAAELGEVYRDRFPRTSRATGDIMVLVEVVLTGADQPGAEAAPGARTAPPPVDDPAHAPGHRHLPPPSRQASPAAPDIGGRRDQPWIRRSHSDSGQRRYRRGR